MITKKIHCYFLLYIFIFLVSSETITFSADFMSGSQKENNTKTLLSGNGYVKTEKMEISADEIVLSGKDYNRIEAKGNVKGKHQTEEFSFTCQNLIYDREKKIAILEESATMDDEKNEVVANAEYIHYNEETQIATMQIKVLLKQKESVCTAAFALYRKAQQLLELRGSPQITRNNDTFRAQVIEFNLTTEEITLDGRVRGTITDTKNE